MQTYLRLDFEVSETKPITVAARSKAWTVFARPNTRIVGSNPWMSVCVYSVFVLSYVQVVALWRADTLSKQSCRLFKIKKLKKRPRPNKGL
jgi:hypothetical protein